MRHYMYLPDDHGFELRLVRVPRSRHIFPVAQSLQHRYVPYTGDVPNRQQQPVEKLLVGFLRRMVSDQDYWILSPILRHRSSKWHQLGVRKLHQNGHSVLPTGKLVFNENDRVFNLFARLINFLMTSCQTRTKIDI